MDGLARRLSCGIMPANHAGESVEIKAENYGDPLIATTIADRYEILSMIGIGGWSSVYRANDNSLKRPVAVKVLHPHLCIEKGKIERFQREAEATSAIAHPNLAAIYDCGLLAGIRPYFVMELISGTPLADMIQKEQSLSPHVCIPLFAQILDALSVIHNLGLLHRDLKPGNILISEAGIVKVLDFGMSKWILQDNPLTKTDEAVGTPAYMSPEQCLGKKLDCRCDIYSLGCMLYEALSGAKPFHSDNLLECMQMHIKMKPPRLRSSRADTQIPKTLEAVVTKTLSKNPEDRYSSAQELKRALMESLKTPTISQNIQALISLEQISKRRKRQALLFAVCALVVAAIAVVPISQMLKQRSLKFPAGHSVGAVYLIYKDPAGTTDEKKLYAHARGTVNVPYASFVQLSEVPPEDALNLSFLTKLDADDLQGIDLYNEGLGTDAVPSINHLAGLKTLSLNRSSIDDGALAQLKLPALEGLDLTETGVSNDAFKEIAEREPVLQWIAMKRCKNVGDGAIAALARIASINCIILDNVPAITDRGLQPLDHAPKLTIIVLNHDKISDTGMQYISRLSKLNRLDLGGTSITDKGVEQLSKLSELRRLDLSETAITDKSIDTLAQFKHLRSLFVSSVKMTPEGLSRLKRALPECEITEGQ